MKKRPVIEPRQVELRRYPNRRFYDAAQRKHVTLEAIYQLIRDGSDVTITDTQTGEDITAKVLTLIILEHDAPKLDVFPAELLHQLIRTNEPLVREFVDKYFSQAFAAFVESQRQFSDYLRSVLGLGETAENAWTRMMLGPMAPALFPHAMHPAGSAPPLANDSGNGTDELRTVVKELQDQVQSLQEQLKHSEQPTRDER
jgi:polyhydroxyalkanoate synthesis repressor PhaR